MRFYLMIFLFLLSTNTASAQFARFLPGQITFNSGETKTGYIEKTVSEKITYEVNFKENKKDEKGSIYSVDQLKRFQFKDGLKFVAEEITYATDAEGKEQITELAFLEELEAGAIGLLEFDNHEYRGLFLKKKNGELEILAQQEQACSDYMSILREEMADCEEVVVKEVMWFNSRVIQSLIEDYNYCGKEKEKLKIKIGTGFPYRFSAHADYQLTGSWAEDIGTRNAAGFHLNIRAGERGLAKKILLNFGALRYTKNLDINERTAKLDETQFSEIYLGMKTKLAVNSHIFPTISFGVGGYFNSNSSDFRRLKRQDDFKPLHLRYGLGVQFVKDRHIGELVAGGSNGIYLGLSYGYQF